MIRVRTAPSGEPLEAKAHPGRFKEECLGGLRLKSKGGSSGWKDGNAMSSVQVSTQARLSQQSNALENNYDPDR